MRKVTFESSQSFSLNSIKLSLHCAYIPFSKLTKKDQQEVDCGFVNDFDPLPVVKTYFLRYKYSFETSDDSDLSKLVMFKDCNVEQISE